MMTRMSAFLSIASAAMFGVGLGAWLFAAPPARALIDTAHVLSGGSTLGEFQTRFTAPGLAAVYDPDIPAPGLGEGAAQIVMPAGTLSRLRVKMQTAAFPTIGSFTAMVRVNGADTALTCSLNAPGTCSTGGKVKGLNNNALLAVRVSNTFTDSGAITFSYTLQFD
jgi:hypothetical protein